MQVFLVLLTFLFIVGIYWYYIYLRIYENLLLILKKAHGKIRKGNYIFAVPHSIKFLYADRLCQISHSVDWKLDHLIEFSFSIKKEIELIIVRRNIKGSENQDLLNKFIVAGEDKAVFTHLMNEQAVKSVFLGLMHDFRFLLFGKDSRIRLSERYDSYLTRPKIALQILDKMVILANFFEDKIIK